MLVLYFCFRLYERRAAETNLTDPLMSTPQIASVPSEAHCPSLDHTDDPYSVFPEQMGKLQYTCLLVLGFFRQSARSSILIGRMKMGWESDMLVDEQNSDILPFLRKAVECLLDRCNFSLVVDN